MDLYNGSIYLMFYSLFIDPLEHFANIYSLGLQFDVVCLHHGLFCFFYPLSLI